MRFDLRAFKRAARRTPAWTLYTEARGAIERRLGLTYEPRRYWDRHAREYVEERLGRGSESEAREIAALVSDLQGAHPVTVLEVGCAYGRLLAIVADADPAAKLVGIDLSAAMLTNASRHLANPAISLLQADAACLPLGDQTFDLAYTYGLMMHIPPTRIDAVVGELSRVAKHAIVCLETDFPPGWQGRALESHAYSSRVFAHDYATLFQRHGWGMQHQQRIGSRVEFLLAPIRTREKD